MLAQILLLDIVFSLDSVITAVGMTENLVVIVTVVVLSFGIMLFASRFIFTFVNRHPTVKMLALSFLLLIGVFLIAEGFGMKIDKALIYAPMAFAILVEALNLVCASRKAKRGTAAPAGGAAAPAVPRRRRVGRRVGGALEGRAGAGSVGLSATARSRASADAATRSAPGSAERGATDPAEWT